MLSAIAAAACWREMLRYCCPRHIADADAQHAPLLSLPLMLFFFFFFSFTMRHQPPAFSAAASSTISLLFHFRRLRLIFVLIISPFLFAIHYFRYDKS